MAMPPDPSDTDSESNDSDPPLALVVDALAVDDPDATGLSDQDGLSDNSNGIDEDVEFEKPQCRQNRNESTFLKKSPFENAVENGDCHNNEGDFELSGRKACTGHKRRFSTTESGSMANKSVDGIDESLSDIDDDEIEGYIRTNAEAEQKELWWNEMYT